jgi:hypothetical protein
MDRDDDDRVQQVGPAARRLATNPRIQLPQECVGVSVILETHYLQE